MAVLVTLVLFCMAARGAADSLRGAPEGNATARQLSTPQGRCCVRPDCDGGSCEVCHISQTDAYCLESQFNCEEHCEGKWCPEPAPTQCNAGGDIDVDEVCAAYCQGEYCYTSGGHAVQHGTSEQCWQCQCDNRSPEPMGDKFFTYVSLVSGCSSAYVDQDCVRSNNWQGCYCWRLQGP